MARPTPTTDDNSIQSLSDTVVTCCLCNLVFDEDERHPRLLPCLHSACNRCLGKKNKNKECITCTHCKTEYDLSKCPVTIFPKDNTKTGVLRLFRLKNGEETIKCQECEDELVAQFHCETCSKQLCNDCHQYHRRAKRSHVVSCLQNIPFTLDSAKIFDTRGKCHVSGHEVENLDYYCKKCDIAICSRCVCTIHKEVNGHQTENVCDVYENKKQALISDQLVMENRMSQIDKTIKMIETEIPNININSDIASDEIKHTLERVYGMLKDKENDMLKDLKLQAKKKTICLQEQKVKLLSQKQNMADAANFLEASLATSDHSAILSIAPSIYNRLSYLNAQAVDSAPYENACLKFVEFNFAKFPLNVGRLVSPPVYGPRTRILLPEPLYAGEEIAMSLELYDYGGNIVDTAELQVCIDVLKDDKNCLFDNPVSCVQKKPGTWSCLLNIQLPGEYEAKVSVFGVKLETIPIILDVDTVPVLASAQIPVSESSQSYRKRVEYCSPQKDKSDSDDGGFGSHKQKPMSHDNRFANPRVKFKFETRQGMVVKLYQGYITKCHVDGIVNATNDHLMNSGGVALAISKEAGYELDKACEKIIKKRKKIYVTENCVTTGGNLPCTYVIHVVGPQWNDYRTKTEKEDCLNDLFDTVFNILDTGHKEKMSVIVMPPISSGIFAVPREMCAAMYIKGILQYSKDHPGSNVKEFHIIDIRNEMLDLIEAVYRKWERSRKGLDPKELLKDWVPAQYTGSCSNRTTYNRQSFNPSKRVHGDQNQDQESYSWNANQAGALSGNHGVMSKEVMKGKTPGRRVYDFKGCLQVHIYSGDMIQLQSKVDAIVSTENRSVSGSGGLARALLEKAGDRYREQHKNILVRNKQNHLPLRSVAMTGAGKLKFRNIFHVVVEQFSASYPPTLADKWYQNQTVKIVLERINAIAAGKKNKEIIQKIAMSLFGSREITTPMYLQIHCQEVYNAIARFVHDHEAFNTLNIIEIHLVNTREEVTNAFNTVFEARSIEKPTTAPKRPERQYDKGPEKQHQDKGPEKQQQGHGRYEFMPDTFKWIANWKIEKKSMKQKVESYFEPMVVSEDKKRKSSTALSKPMTAKPGNFMVIDNETDRFDKSKSMTVRGIELKYSSSKSNAKTHSMKDGPVECYGCKAVLNSESKPVPLKCGHYFCFSCHPVYKNKCICSDEDISAGARPQDVDGASNDVLVDESAEDCVICMDTMEDPVQLKQCKHMFCRDCITNCFTNKAACPMCNTVYGAMFGNQPSSGQANVYEDKESLPGYPDCATFIIDYDFPSGKQQENHPSPGQTYKGLRRQAYLPKNKEGKEVLRMLKLAFQQGLTFTIGTSRTTGEENVLTWNDIHHKTRRVGGPERFGYPDNNYIARVIDELEAKGIQCEIDIKWDDF